MKLQRNAAGILAHAQAEDHEFVAASSIGTRCIAECYGNNSVLVFHLVDSTSEINYFDPVVNKLTIH